MSETPAETTTMLTMKGADYVAAWAEGVARKLGLSVEYVAEAINTIAPDSHVNRFAFYPLEKYSLERDYAIGVVGGLTPEQAKSVVAELRRIKQDNARAKATTCWCCGLPMDGDYCDACGPMDAR